jgi:DNA polymerase-3 subunit delta
MLIFLYGSDSYRLKQNLDKIINEYRKKHTSGLNFLLVDLAESAQEGLGRLDEFVKTSSFFDEKKFAVVKNGFEKSAGVLDLIERWGLAKDKDRIFAFVENGPKEELVKKDKKLFFTLAARPNISRSFDPLSGRQLEKWILERGKKLGLVLDRGVLMELVSYEGHDLWQLNLELEKIANFAMATGKSKISSEELKSLVIRPLNLNIFETVEAIGARDKGRAIVLLNRHLESGTDPYYLFSMVVYQFRNLLWVKSLQSEFLPNEAMAKKTGLHPFVVKKSAEQAKKFELSKLIKKFKELAEADRQIKDGIIEAPDFLYKFILS